MVYFGCIDEVHFNELSTEEQKELFLMKEVLVEVPTVQLANKGVPTNNTMDNSTKKLIISKDLVQEFYSFLLKTLDADIEAPYVDFFHDFEEKTYGSRPKEKRKLAKKNFKKISREYIPTDLLIYQNPQSSKGIKNLELQSILSSLFDQQNLLKYELADTDLLNQFIFGNKEIFEVSILLDQILIDLLIDFESNLKILVSLNDQFNFEKDEYFTNIAILKEKYHSKFYVIFKSFDAYYFAHQQISQIKNLHNVQIEGLYQAMVDADIINKNAPIFQHFVNDEYNLTITKIRSYFGRNNKSHIKRVKEFSSKWSEFSPNN